MRLMARQQGALATAAGADDRGDQARRYVQRDLLDRLIAAVENREMLGDNDGPRPLGSAIFSVPHDFRFPSCVSRLHCCAAPLSAELLRDSGTQEDGHQVQYEDQPTSVKAMPNWTCRISLAAACSATSE